VYGKLECGGVGCLRFIFIFFFKEWEFGMFVGVEIMLLVFGMYFVWGLLWFGGLGGIVVWEI
jgi:hypothetical protein